MTNFTAQSPASTMTVTPNKTKKSVTWSRNCKLRTYVRANAEQDRYNSWYQPTDYSKFKKNCTKISYLAQNNGIEKVEEKFQNETCCGLERMISQEISALVSKRRSIAWGAVLSEQARQSKNNDSTDPLRIAQVYSEISHDSHIHAHKRAIRLKTRLFNEASLTAVGLPETDSPEDGAGATRHSDPEKMSKNSSHTLRSRLSLTTSHFEASTLPKNHDDHRRHNSGNYNSNIVPAIASIGKTIVVVARYHSSLHMTEPTPVNCPQMSSSSSSSTPTSARKQSHSDAAAAAMA